MKYSSPSSGIVWLSPIYLKCSRRLSFPRYPLWAVYLTVQETSRHLSRLEKVGLTEKDVDGLHYAIRYAGLVLNQLPALDFEYQNRDYFNSHSLDGLPKEFVSRIGELKDSTLVEDIFIGFNNIGRMLQEAEE